MLTPLRNLIRRPLADWSLLAEALIALVVAKFRIHTRPFRRLAPSLGHPQAETLLQAPPPTDGKPLSHRISWAVETAARYVPFGFVCLPQAMAAQILLARRSVWSTLYLGVATSKEKPFTAHAWLRSGPKVVTGENARPGQTVVATFACITPTRLSHADRVRLTFGLFSVLGLLGASLSPLSPLHTSLWQEFQHQWRPIIHWIGSHDFVANLIGIGLINLGLHFAWFGFHRDPWTYRLRSMAVVGAMILGIECLQLALPYRHFDPCDLLAAALIIPVTTLPWINPGQKR